MENLDLSVIIIISSLAAVLVLSLIIFFVLKNKKKKTALESKERSQNMILALGNKENIVSVDAKESRLNLVLHDNNLIDELRLKELGVSSIIKTSKKVTLVVGKEASKEVEEFIGQYQDKK